MPGHADVRAYAELNDFLAPELHGLTVRRPFRTHQTVKDVLEAMGIPHREVDLIVLNGNAVDFEHRPAPGDRIAAYPMFEALEVGSTSRLRPAPLRDSLRGGRQPRSTGVAVTNARVRRVVVKGRR